MLFGHQSFSIVVRVFYTQTRDQGIAGLNVSLPFGLVLSFGIIGVFVEL